MSTIEGIFSRLIIFENGKLRPIRTIEDSEHLLEKLTGIRENARRRGDEGGGGLKKDLDYLIWSITQMTALAYTREKHHFPEID
ncbi:MAG TPA: hypothetical protein ENN34_09190 [Deltaproteobacteria bacterium]|nr:hypothetical protein [Deltaproteobacteria bacterium]